MRKKNKIGKENVFKKDRSMIDDPRLEGALAMAGGICHELNQPLQVVSGYSEILLMNVPEDNPLHEKILKIKEQVRLMGQITEKLMGITSYETKDYLENKIFDINKASTV